MNDTEIKQAIIEICETLKVSLGLLSDLNRSQVALSKTIFQDRPEMQTLYDQQWNLLIQLTARSLGPSMSEQLAKIDELIRKMKG